jgi:hypothetical protein
MYPSLHDAISVIPATAASPDDRQASQFTRFAVGAARILSEATEGKLPVEIGADIEFPWQRAKRNLSVTSPKLADAVYHFLGLVRAAPFGTDILGIYWGAFGFDGVRVDAKAEREEKAAGEYVANLRAGYTDGFDFPAGNFGRLALMMMRSGRDRIDLTDRASLSRSGASPCLTESGVISYRTSADPSTSSRAERLAIDISSQRNTSSRRHHSFG